MKTKNFVFGVIFCFGKVLAMQDLQPKDFAQKYFETDTIYGLFCESLDTEISGLRECFDSSCILRRNKQPECRKFFENTLLELFDQDDFVSNLKSTKLLRITDFSSGYLFQTLVIVRKMLDKALLVDEFSHKKLTCVVDIIDTLYAKKGCKEVISDFKAYFLNFYNNRFKINFICNVFSDGQKFIDILNSKKFVESAHAVVCVDNSRNIPKEFGPEDLISDLSELYFKKNESFWFYSLSKYGFLEETSSKTFEFPCVFYLKVNNKDISLVEPDKNILINVIPLYRINQRHLYGAFISHPELRKQVPLYLNLSKI